MAVKGGSIMDRATFGVVRAEMSPAEIQIEDDLYIAPRTAGEVEASLLHLNHSCDPTSGFAVKLPSWRCVTSRLRATEAAAAGEPQPDKESHQCPTCFESLCR